MLRSYQKYTPVYFQCIPSDILFEGGSGWNEDDLSPLPSKWRTWSVDCNKCFEKQEKALVKQRIPKSRESYVKFNNSCLLIQFVCFFFQVDKELKVSVGIRSSEIISSSKHWKACRSRGSLSRLCTSISRVCSEPSVLNRAVPSGAASCYHHV